MGTVSVLTIGDPHFKVSNAVQSDEMTEKVVAKAKELKPDMIVCLGDVLDRHEMIHVAPLTRAIHFLRQLSEIAMLYVIIGNHDRPNNSNFLTDEHPFNALKKWPNTMIVDKVCVDIVKNHKMVFVPYVPPGRFSEALNTVEGVLEATRVIFAHQEFYGAKMGVVVSNKGDIWPLNYPLVISGHLHDYDELQSNMIYVGTPMAHAFGDRSDKTVSIFRFYEGGNFEHERIDLDLTKKMIVYLKPQEVATYTPPERVLVKLVIRGDSAEIKAVMKTTKIKELQKSGVKISYKQIETNDSNTNLLGSGQIEEERQVSYLVRLYRVIKDDPEQVKWFEKLYGKCKDEGGN